MELLQALASGNAVDAAEIAASLASIVKRRLEASSEAPNSTASPAPDVTLPPVTEASMDHALDKLADVMARQASDDAPPPEGTSSAASSPSTPWMSTKHITVTILETSFEVSDDDGVAEDHERILDQYLTQESERWKAQKHAIANIVLQCARECGITPLALHEGEGDTASSSSSRASGTINVLKHCNLVIRGEVPDSITSASLTGGSSTTDDEMLASCRDELAALERRYTERGIPPMSPRDRSIALMELIMSRTSVRYSVGLKKDLSSTLDRLAALGATAGTTGANAFHQKVISALNEVRPLEAASPSGAAAATTPQRQVQQPVLPYSFMVKLCLWFDASAVMNADGAINQ